MSDVPEMAMQRSSRDSAVLRAQLERWLGEQLPEGADPAVAELQATSANGLSSDTVLFDATWNDRDERRAERLVARIAPDEVDVPVFPSYDLRRQFDVIRLVGERTTVPVPKVWWLEPAATAIGAPFFVMGRVDGEVPPDVMPYNFGDSWVFDAAPADQARLQQTSVEVLAHLHAADDPVGHFSFLEYDDAGDTHLRRHVEHARAWYEFAKGDTGPSPLVERGFAWLDDHWPTVEGAPVVSWGDARLGNMMYRDFEPVAVLDWEMAGLGPRELDLAWLIFAHRVFEDLANMMGLPGMPEFLRRDDVAAAYEAATGYTPRDLDFYLVYAAVQWGVVFLRTGWRQVHFGEIEAPGAPEELMHHRDTLERLLDGTYWT